MDIKLKKSNKRLIAMIAAFLICVTSFSAAVTIGMTELLKASQVGNPFSMMSAKTYEESMELQEEFSSKLGSLHWYAASISEGNEEDAYVSSLITPGFSFYVSDGSAVLTNMGEKEKISRYSPETLPDHLKGAGGAALSETELQQLGQAQGAYRLYTNGDLTGEPQINLGRVAADRRIRNQIAEYTDYGVENILGQTSDTGKLIVYMAFTDDYLNGAKAAYENVGAEFKVGMIIALACILVWLISFIAACVLCGKQDENGRTVLTGIDRWFSELHIAALVFSVIMGCLVCVTASEVSYSNYYDYYGYGLNDQYTNTPVFNWFEITATGVGLWVCAAAALTFLLALMKKVKAGCFFRDFFVVRIFLWIWTGLKDIYYGSSVMKKVIILVALICLCSATVVFFPVVLVVSLVFASKWVKQYEAIKTGVREVKNGNPSYKIPIEGERDGELQQLAADINAISEGFDLAVKQELKNQRMKTELISNVSHDIKTPLTSIITYVDLLKKEGLDCEDAPKYLDILDQKSVRLKKLTEDLFEAAKASSGDIPVNMEKVELLSLLNQTLGEMDDRLASRGLDVIVKTDKERYYVEADGQLMWRVLENLFGNAIKYALQNSRVYVDIHEVQISADGRTAAVFEMKNISQNPLNIPADELMERFKRGDEARSTEGSGLGLAIARDLMHIQHGNFDIIIDGDLFKAVITLKTCQ